MRVSTTYRTTTERNERVIFQITTTATNLRAPLLLVIRGLSFLFPFSLSLSLSHLFCRVFLFFSSAGRNVKIRKDMTCSHEEPSWRRRRTNRSKVKPGRGKKDGVDALSIPWWVTTWRAMHQRQHEDPTSLPVPLHPLERKKKVIAYSVYV